MSCGLATTTVTTAARAAKRSLSQATSPASAGRPISQGSTATMATNPAMIADSWSVSSAAPRTTPRIVACRQPCRRRSRTAASSANGRKIAPSAPWISYQAFHVIIVDRPKNAPAAIAAVCDGSHSRAARYIA